VEVNCSLRVLDDWGGIRFVIVDASLGLHLGSASPEVISDSATTKIKRLYLAYLPLFC
jgi:hypothetical protein